MAIGAFANMSFAENLGTGSLADGFTRLGDPRSLRNAQYRLEVTTVPEPSAVLMLWIGLAVMRWRRHHVRTTLHRLRKLLGVEFAVRIEGRRICLDTRRVWTDCAAFDQGTDDLALRDVRKLQQAVNRYRGTFLPGESQPWAIAARQMLHARYLRVAERLGGLYEERGAWQEALDCYLRAIEREPLAEALYRRLMLAHSRLQHRPEALLAYQRCRQALLSRLGVGPAMETRALYESLGGS